MQARREAEFRLYARSVRFTWVPGGDASPQERVQAGGGAGVSGFAGPECACFSRLAGQAQAPVPSLTAWVPAWVFLPTHSNCRGGVRGSDG